MMERAGRRLETDKPVDVELALTQNVRGMKRADIMHFKFNLKKTVQAAAEFLRHEPGKQMSRLRLIKLLYIADREALLETGRPITSDTIVAMKHGPVLSRF